MSDQLEFLPKRTKPVRKAASLAEVNPVAQVRIDAPLPHLDRIFDYSIPAALDEQVQSGVRVRVRLHKEESGRHRVELLGILADHWYGEKLTSPQAGTGALDGGE